MNNATRKRLLDALTACRAIATFTEGRDFADYESDALLRSGVERQFEILGEALRRAEEHQPDLANLIPELKRIVGMRNRIIHGYDAVDDELVWDAVKFEISPLIEQISRLMKED
jgi:uncharacterized protein with HEPN domain